MAIQEIDQPYEFLARWRDGVLSGAHVRFVKRVTDGGRVLVETIGDALAVDAGSGKGFPLADLLRRVEVDALAALTQMTAERDSLRLTVTDLEAARDRLTEQVSELQLSAAKAAEVATTQADQLAAVAAERDDLLTRVPKPRGPREVLPEELIERLTVPQVIALTTSPDPAAIYARTLLQTRSSPIDLDSERFRGLLDSLVAAKVFTAAELTSLLE